MTAPPASEPPGPEPVGLALDALAFGIAAGVSLLALVTWGLRTAQGLTPPGAPPAGPTEGGLYALVIGTVVGMAAAGTATWSLLAALRNPWRQAMLAIVAGFASFVIAALVTVPVDRALGRPGLLGLAAVSGLACFGIGRRINRRRRSA